MSKLDKQDLSWAVRRLPKNLKDIMQEPNWAGRIFVGGGYLRSIEPPASSLRCGLVYTSRLAARSV